MTAFQNRKKSQNFEMFCMNSLNVGEEKRVKFLSDAKVNRLKNEHATKCQEGEKRTQIRKHTDELKERGKQIIFGGVKALDIMNVL